VFEHSCLDVRSGGVVTHFLSAVIAGHKLGPFGKSMAIQKIDNRRYMEWIFEHEWRWGCGILQ
jgi:hypothetical protein